MDTECVYKAEVDFSYVSSDIAPTNMRFTNAVQEPSSHIPHSSSRTGVSPYAPHYGSILVPLPPLGCSIHPAIDAAGHLSVSWKAIASPRIHPSFLRPGAPLTIFDQAVTSPALPYLDISIPQLPWVFRVIPRTHSYVTVMDLLFCLYSQLREPVTENEVAQYFHGRQFQMVIDSFHARCRGASKEDKSRGVRRIDCLGRQTRFAGLMHAKRANGDPHAFEVCFS